MGFYTYYQAIHERSRLLERLRSEKKFCTLYTRLIPYGPGPFHLAKLDPGELNDILDGFAEDELFGSRTEVDRCLNDLQTELVHAATVYPGLENRSAYIEKEHDEIELPLTNELRRRGSEADVKLMWELLYGCDALAPEYFGRYESQLRLVRASAVAEGAKMLEGVELSEEAHDISDYACEQYQDWKRFIIAAAGLSEAVLVFKTG